MATQQERRAATRARLEAAGRTLFGRAGFDAVAATSLVAAAGVTRGALYHHYDGKEGLFEAVLDTVMAEVAADVAAAASTATSAAEAIRLAARRFLEVAQDDELRRLLFVDAPNVLGWSRWRALDEAHGLGLLTQAVAGLVPAPPAPRVTARLLMSAMIEAAMLAAQGGADGARAAEELDRVVAALVAGPTAAGGSSPV